MTTLWVLQDVLRRRHSEGWSVGGTVRDHLLGRPSPDLDVVVADDPAAVSAELAAALGCAFFPLSVRHGAYRVLGPAGRVDIAGLRGARIHDDLALRDFTMNAIAVPVLAPGGRLIDPFEGRLHLAARVLAPVSDHIFEDDPLRLMRAVRFCHVLKMVMDPRLSAMVSSQARRVGAAAPERIAGELAMMLELGGAGGAVHLLWETGLLREILPEGDAEAPFAILDALDMILEAATEGNEEWRALVRGRFDAGVDGTFSRPAALRLAAILRRTKPQSIAAAAARLKLSGGMSSLLSRVSAWYAETADAGWTARRGLSASARNARSATLLLWNTAPWEVEVILIGAADGDDFSGPDSGWTTLLERWAVRVGGRPAPPFDGRVLMEALHMEQGPELGRVLRETRLAWESGEIRGLEEALEVAAAARSAAGGLRQ